MPVDTGRVVLDPSTRWQVFGTGFETISRATVDESMAKRDEIPDAKKPERTYKHAASVEQVEALRSRVEALGVGWHDGVAAAGVSRNVGFTLLRGQGSVGSLRTIEVWVARQEELKRNDLVREPREAWAALGVELEGLGADELATTIEAVREYIAAEKRRRAAFSKLLRVTPEPNR